MWFDKLTTTSIKMWNSFIIPRNFPWLFMACLPHHQTSTDMFSVLVGSVALARVSCE